MDPDLHGEAFSSQGWGILDGFISFWLFCLLFFCCCCWVFLFLFLFSLRSEKSRGFLLVMLSAKKEARNRPACWWALEFWRKMLSPGSQEVWPQLGSHKLCDLGQVPSPPLWAHLSVHHFLLHMGPGSITIRIRSYSF